MRCCPPVSWSQEAWPVITWLYALTADYLAAPELLYCITDLYYCTVLLITYCFTWMYYCSVLLGCITVLFYLPVLQYCFACLYYCTVFLGCITVLYYCISLLYFLAAPPALVWNWQLIRYYFCYWP